MILRRLPNRATRRFISTSVSRLIRQTECRARSLVSRLFTPLARNRLHFLDGVPKIIECFELTIYRCEAYVSDLVQPRELPHYEVAYTVGRYLALTKRP